MSDLITFHKWAERNLTLEYFHAQEAEAPALEFSARTAAVKVAANANCKPILLAVLALGAETSSGAWW